jgi:hypothetical protein
VLQVPIVLIVIVAGKVALFRVGNVAGNVAALRVIEGTTKNRVVAVDVIVPRIEGGGRPGDGEHAEQQQQRQHRLHHFCLIPIELPDRSLPTTVDDCLSVCIDHFTLFTGRFVLNCSPVNFADYSNAKC